MRACTIPPTLQIHLETPMQRESMSCNQERRGRCGPFDLPAPPEKRSAVDEQEVEAMCMTCGCGQAHKRMGSNITWEDIRDVAQENNKTVDETLNTLRETAEKDRNEHREEYDKPWQVGARG
jgi:hypothetical protein